MPTSHQARRQVLRQEIRDLKHALAQDPSLSGRRQLIERVIDQNQHMATFVTMLVRRLREHAPHDDLARSAMAFIMREGIHGSPLRAVDLEMFEAEAQTAHHSTSIDQRATSPQQLQGESR